MSVREEAGPPDIGIPRGQIRTPKRQLVNSAISTPSSKRQLISSAVSTPSFEQAETSPVATAPASATVQGTPSAPIGIEGYYNLVQQASEYLTAINNAANESRITMAYKSQIMDMTQRLTSVVSLLAFKSAALESKLVTAERDLANFKPSDVPAPASVPIPTATYAESVKLRLPKTVPSVQARAPLPCVVAYPSEEKVSEFTDSSATKAALMKAIKPSDGFQIVGVKKTGKSGVVLRVTNETQIKKLENVAAIKSAGLRLEKPKGRRPRILVKDIPATLSDEEFLAAFYRQNIRDEIKISEDEFNRGTKIIRRRKLDNGRKWIGVELDPKIRKHIISTKDKLFIEWATCRFADDIELVRCLKCQQFGHVVKYCTEKAECCAHCAESHDSRECPKKSLDNFKPICATCKRYKKPCDHATGSTDCPSYKGKLQALILHTQYE